MDAAAEELAALDRVFFRLSGVVDEELPPLVAILLPRLLTKLAPGPQAPAARARTLEVLNHISSRVRGQPHLALPLR